MGEKKEKDDSTNSEDVDIELAGTTHHDNNSEKKEKDDSTNSEKAWWDVSSGLESGVLPLEEQVEEDHAIFLFRSRGFLWLGSMVLAIGFIFGIFGFYEDHILTESGMPS